jgi:hypothetical protein
MRELVEHRGYLLAEHGLRRGLMSKLVKRGGNLLLLLHGELHALVTDTRLNRDASRHSAGIALARQTLSELAEA